MTTQVDQFGERNEYNFVADGSFENEVSEWENESDADGGTGAQWTIGNTPGVARSGIAYATRASSVGTQRRFFNQRVFDIFPEHFLHIEGYVLVGSVNAILGVRWTDETGTFIQNDTASVVLATGRLVGRIVPPEGAVRGQIFLNTAGGASAVSIDDIFAAQFPSHLAPLAETSPLGTDNDSSTRANTAFGDLADTANSPSVDFIAPPNGRVLVTVSALAQSSAAGSKAVMGYQIIDLTDSSVFQDASTVRAAASASANEITVTRVAEVSGLVPGRSYRARAKYRSFGVATATFQDRRIIVQPALGVT